jgi:hypothetical protein
MGIWKLMVRKVMGVAMKFLSRNPSGDSEKIHEKSVSIANNTGTKA